MCDPKYVESVAYHEAGHIVIAAVQGVPLRPGGIHIDRVGAGMSFYKSKVSTHPGSDAERERTIIATFAGWASQFKFDLHCPEAGASDDVDLINALLDEILPGGGRRWFDARSKLQAESKRLVDEHWQAIDGLARALWARPWTPQPVENQKRWSKMTEEKYISGDDAASFLQQFGIQASVVGDAVGIYTSRSDPLGC